MSTATLPLHTADRAEPACPPAAGERSAARAFLLRYAVTMLPMVAALVALHLGAQLLPESIDAVGGGWPVSVALVSGWALAVAGWLRRCGWPIGTPAAVGAALAAPLALTAAAGWLSPSGLLLWGPVGAVLSAALTTAAGPAALGPEDGRGPGRSDQGLSTWGE